MRVSTRKNPHVPRQTTQVSPMTACIQQPSLITLSAWTHVSWRQHASGHRACAVMDPTGTWLSVTDAEFYDPKFTICFFHVIIWIDNLINGGCLNCGILSRVDVVIMKSAWLFIDWLSYWTRKRNTFWFASQRVTFITHVVVCLDGSHKGNLITAHEMRSIGEDHNARWPQPHMM